MSDYIGRFAPSPTGPLHMGSLVAAIASYLDARANQGKWLLRMEDLDKPREMPAAVDMILKTLDAFGFEWEGEVLYQSQRHEIYQSYFELLQQTDLLYPCGCTRREIESIAHAGIEGSVYPGTCRHDLPANKEVRAWRLKVPEQYLCFTDHLQGRVQHQLQSDIGDFILKRADGLFAYQLAVVVDDAEQNITHVVRGADLLNSTSRQIYLQQLLSFITPEYAHIPLVVNTSGQKLSKQTKAPAITTENVESQLVQALHFLGMHVPRDRRTLNEIWQWCQLNWQPNNNIMKSEVNRPAWNDIDAAT